MSGGRRQTNSCECCRRYQQEINELQARIFALESEKGLHDTIPVSPSVLSEGLPGVVFGENHRVTEGQDIAVKCDFIFDGSRRIFCKNDCRDERDILVETTENRAVKDRYSIQFDKNTRIMTVGIKKVQLSDSGQYKCWLDRTRMIDGEEKFKIHVTKAPSPVKPPAPPLPPVIPRTTAVRPTHSPDPSPDPDPDPDPDPGLDSGTSIRPEHEQTVTPHGSPTGSLLYPVGVTLAVILTLFSVALLLFYCKRKEINPEESPEILEVPEIVAAGYCIYQSLDLDTIGPNQIYSTISVQQGALKHAHADI